MADGTQCSTVPQGHSFHSSLAAHERGVRARWAGVTETDRKLFSADTMEDLRELLPTELSDVDREFAALPPDADVATRARLANQMAPDRAIPCFCAMLALAPRARRGERSLTLIQQAPGSRYQTSCGSAEPAERESATSLREDRPRGLDARGTLR